MTMSRNEGYTYQEKLGARAAGLTVLEYLSGRYQHSSRQDWQDRIDTGRIHLDGSPVGPTQVLETGQTLAWHRPAWNEPEAPTGFAVLYLDRHLLGVAKPQGLPTLPGGGFLESTLLHLVRKSFPEASPLHRLGRGTSGVALFALSDLARAAMTDAWQKAEVTRLYRALVLGRFEADEFEIDVPIGPVEHPLIGKVHAANQDGKPARSKIRRLEKGEETSLVEVSLVTGRPHQIRIHLAYAGFPLVGDPLYPRGGVPRRDTTALPGDLGYLLHAELLRFAHPESGILVEIFCAPPPQLCSIIGKVLT
jgi:23S rRNA pseudouridine1911/1915/1917 synthase